MPNKGPRRNYQLELDRIIKDLDPGDPGSVLLHCCCGPCASYCLKYLTEWFPVTVLFYNPNIYPEAEYLHRKSELMRLIGESTFSHPVSWMDCDYDHSGFLNACSALAGEPEGGRRCLECFSLRLGFTAKTAAEHGFRWFCSTLTVSPHKDAEAVNSTGEKMAEKYGSKWLPSDFKKRDGYLLSIKYSKEHNLYRQNYCGCEFSLR
ncbi:MAG: epoxyqueuosine reductase QueH [Oscillospiraceae bacterium]